MKTTSGPIIDMTPSGEFAHEPVSGPTIGMIFARVIAFAVLLGVAALAFWLAIFTIPLLMLLGLGGYLYVRFKMRKHLDHSYPIVVRNFRR